ncbi:deoxyribose-phosphate aldolase [Tessaracoccus sp. SD287]|uniref:deoxyribose-phosphate aldolase n=1 Tax=Tessaracoccus sp. SD287 TaxID=2782008 RepID=UPI001A979CE5|nr:deoxyribose-phosphate aldolase [Tessaracoccus sp. SD287]MBO1029798.1 deoxyribose-phosphate aldolase [Tessaracoccus sp. SD287]
MVMTVAEYAKHFDMALHKQDSLETDIRAHAQAARDAGVAACYTNSYWTPVVAEVLQGSDVHVGTAISFPYGCTSTAMKFAEIEEGLELGATAVDMVINIGQLRMGNHDFVRREVEGLVERTAGKALSKVIFEVCFLTDDEIATLTRICSDAGVNYVKTATGSEGFPTESQVAVMRKNITNEKTLLKVSGVPRTFTMAATLWLIDRMGVSLIGTRSAAQLVAQYQELFTERTDS